MAIKLNIQNFNDGFVNPSGWNSACGETDNAAARYGDATGQNKSVLDTLKQVLGAASQEAKNEPVFQALDQLTNHAAEYFHSIDAWSRGVMSAFHQFTLTMEPDHTNTESIQAQHHDNVEDRFAGQNIGISSQGEISSFVSAVEGVIPEISSTLQAVTAAVDSASGSIPDVISSALSSTVQSQNEAIRAKAESLDREITTNAEHFRSLLTDWAGDAAQGAAGGK